MDDYVGKVRGGEQINVFCYSYNKIGCVLVVLKKLESLVFSEENKLKLSNTKWEVYSL